MTKQTQPDKHAKVHKSDKRDEQIKDLTNDLQRVRADFENYRKRVEQEKEMARKSGASKMVIDLLPIIDNIDRAIDHVPESIADQPWVRGIVGLTKQLDATLSKLGISRIDAKSGTIFDPELHQAVQFDEEATGEKEIIAAELQAGYLLNDVPVRAAMVKVTRV